MESFAVYDLAAGGGGLGLCAVPGGAGDYAGDLALLRRWRPDLVLSMTEPVELAMAGAAGLAADLRALGIGWRSLPIRDFAAPDPTAEAQWPAISEVAGKLLARGGRMLVHCRGGCGRSGMAALRLMVEQGEPAAHSLARLRHVRPCAVETDAQRQWAIAPGDGPGADRGKRSLG